MVECLPEPRQQMSQFAPKIETIQIPVNKIGELIGPGGKVIREIVEVSGAKVDINDEGVIKIASPNGEAISERLAYPRYQPPRC